MTEISRSDQSTIAFLRMAAVEMRRLIERAPEIAVTLRHIAAQCDAQADELVSRNAE